MNQIRIIGQKQEELDQRPIAITIICILGFMGAGLTIPMVFSEIAMQIGKWFPPYSAFVTVVSLVCMIGLWFTKKWAAYTYACLAVLNQIVLTTMGRWNMITLVIQALIVLITLSYLDFKVRSIVYQSIRYIRKQIWTIIVAYMVGIHNFYKQEDKTRDDVGIVIEDRRSQESGAPKD